MTTSAALRTRRCGIDARRSVRRFDASPCPAPNCRHSGTPTPKSTARSNSKRRRFGIGCGIIPRSQRKVAADPFPAWKELRP